MAKKHLLLKHLALVCPNNFKVFDAFTKEEYVGKKYYSMEEHCNCTIIQAYILSNDIYFTIENDNKDLHITNIDALEERIKNRIFQTPK